MKSYHLKLLCFQIAMCGFTEVLTWVLCSYKEDFAMLNRSDDKSTAVIIGNPRSSDFEVCLNLDYYVEEDKFTS